MSAAGRPHIVHCSPTTPSREVVDDVARTIRNGGVVVFPTETVYGIGVHAWDEAAVARLRAIKQRGDKPLTLHVHSVDEIAAFAKDLSSVAQRVLQQCLPGPLTVVLPGRETPTIGIRVPAHPVAQALLEACRVPVVASSANRAQAAPPVDAEQAIAALAGVEVDTVIDSGPTEWQGPSTVVEILDDTVRVLREGVLTIEQLRAQGVPIP